MELNYDYAIAFILPSNLVAASTRSVLKKLGLRYPVYELSSGTALETARELILKGTRIIISHGMTYHFLKAHLDISLIEMPFSGLDALVAMKKALQFSDKKIVHMGTQKLYHFLLQSMDILGVDKSLLSHYPLDFTRSPAEQANEVLDAGYDVIIGGFVTVNEAIKRGKQGIEFDVDDQIIEATIQNAQSFLNNLIQEENRAELNKAILLANPDGIIAVDNYRKIFRTNTAAEKILKRSFESVKGEILEDVLAQSNLEDISLLRLNPGPPPDYITPIILKEFPVKVRGQHMGSVISIKKVSEIEDLGYSIRKDLLAKGLVAKNHFSNIIGDSDRMVSIKERAKVYSKFDSTILISGETGTGKELFAQSIHNFSRRRNQPFVAINCATLPENLIESELFGYVKGAFTGANREGKTGLFEIANNGTIFFDEISELPIALQSKLLRVIQEKEIIRIGDNKVVHVNVRILCSSNKDLRNLVKEKKFKEDLYYRIATLELKIPPLRERTSDISAIAYTLLEKYNKEHNKNVTSISEDVIRKIQQMPLSGNVRELSNIIERMLILTRTSTIGMDTFLASDIDTPSVSATIDPITVNQPETAKNYNLSDAEKNLITEALDKANGNKTIASGMLGIHPSTLWRKLKTYGLDA